MPAEPVDEVGGGQRRRVAWLESEQYLGLNRIQVDDMNDAPNLEYGDPTVALGGETLRAIVGSGVHGVAIPGTDDHDELGVYMEPPSYVLGIKSTAKTTSGAPRLRACAAAMETPT